MDKLLRSDLVGVEGLEIPGGDFRIFILFFLWLRVVQVR